jgi:hypothetical protein
MKLVEVAVGSHVCRELSSSLGPEHCASDEPVRCSASRGDQGCLDKALEVLCCLYMSTCRHTVMTDGSKLLIAYHGWA